MSKNRVWVLEVRDSKDAEWEPRYEVPGVPDAAFGWRERESARNQARLCRKWWGFGNTRVVPYVKGQK